MSATRRLYLPSSGAPSVSPAFDSAWLSTSGVDRVQAVWDAPSSTAFATQTITPNLTAAVGSYQLPASLVRQYISPPIVVSYGSLAAFTLGEIIIDTNGHAQQVTIPGTSAASPPTWNSTGGTTTDGSVTWQDQGIPTALGLPSGQGTLAALAPYSGSCMVRADGSVTPQAGQLAGLFAVRIVVKLYSAANALKGTVASSSGSAGHILLGGGGSFTGSLLTQGFGSAQPNNITSAVPTLAAGDYVTVEIGCGISGTKSPVTSATASLEFGDAAAFDLGGSTPSNAQGNPWYELTIYTPNSPPPPPPSNLPIPGNAWLIVNEPSGAGFVDRTSYLLKSGPHSFNRQIRQRGNANYTLDIPAGDTYQPTVGQLAYLYDQTLAGASLQFSGVVQSYSNKYVGNQGLRYCSVTVVSLESLYDLALVTTPMQFVNQTTGAIVTALHNAFMSTSPIALGTIQAGTTLPLFNANIGDKLSELFSQLATTSEFTWNVDIQAQALFFGLPSTVAAPFAITSPLALYESVSQRFDGADLRFRQLVKLTPDAFPHSSDYYAGSGQTSFTLSHPASQVTNAWITTSTPNTVVGTFTGVPSAGDTVTIGPASGSWQAGHIYGLGGVIVINGYVQKVTTAGTSGGSQPAFSTILGQTTVDNSTIWTCQGPLGLSTGQDVYTFVTSLDNTQFGQILIQGTAAANCKALVDTINANAAARAVSFSLPTWECAEATAVYTSGASFTLRARTSGSGSVQSVSKTGTAFSWAAAQTSGGTSPQTGVGPNEGATISISVYASGTGISAPCLIYTPGSASVNLATPLNSGTNLGVEYVRADSGVIQVERTDLVNAWIALNGGNGKYQRSTDASNTGLIATSPETGLLLAQQALAAFDTVPTEIQTQLFQPGLVPGQQVTLGLSPPLDAVNGNYYVEEIRAELVPIYPYLDPGVPGGGHYRYTQKLINVAQIGSYMDFWQSMAGGGGGGAIPLVATSGGLTPTSPTGAGLAPYSTSWTSQTSVMVTHNLNTTAVIVMVYDGSGNQVIPQNVAVTSSTVVTLTFGAAFTGSVVVIG